MRSRLFVLRLSCGCARDLSYPFCNVTLRSVGCISGSQDGWMVDRCDRSGASDEVEYCGRCRTAHGSGCSLALFVLLSPSSFRTYQHQTTSFHLQSYLSPRCAQPIHSHWHAHFCHSNQAKCVSAVLYLLLSGCCARYTDKLCEFWNNRWLVLPNAIITWLKTVDFILFV